MTNKEKLDYLMLFCGLVVARKQGWTIEKMEPFAPVFGKAKPLLQVLASQ